METDVKAGDNNVNILLSYKELTARVVSNATDFKRAGVTKKQMESQLDEAVSVLISMEIVTGSANADYEQEMKEALRENIAVAREICGIHLLTPQILQRHREVRKMQQITAAD